LHSCHLWASLNLCKYLQATFVFFCASSVVQIHFVNNDFIWSVTYPSYCCHESGCHSPHLLHHTTAALHPRTAFPIHHCTNHTAVTNHSFALIVSPHLHLIHTHTHISSTLPCTHREVLFRRLTFPSGYPKYIFPVCYLDCSHALSLLLSLNLACLTSSYINKAAFGSNDTASSLQSSWTQLMLKIDSVLLLMKEQSHTQHQQYIEKVAYIKHKTFINWMNKTYPCCNK